MISPAHSPRACAYFGGMNRSLIGSLRHSKTHREAVKKAISQRRYSAVIRIGRRVAETCVIDQLAFVRIPEGSRILDRSIDTARMTYNVYVDVPGGKRIKSLHPDVKVEVIKP